MALRFWPFGWLRREKESAGKDSDAETGDAGTETSCGSDSEQEAERSSTTSGSWHSQEHSFSALTDDRFYDMADCMELGIARELVTEFVHPLRRSSKLFKFNVERSQDQLDYWLSSAAGDFLMFAHANLEARSIGFFLYDPTEQGRSLYDPAKPAFTMSFNDSAAEWRLVQERCEHCHFAPEHLSCACCGKQQLAYVKHTKKNIGDGIFRGMDIRIPGIGRSGQRDVWCPMIPGRGDLGAPPKRSSAQSITTKEPSWNDEIGSLTLDFRGRTALSSAKNFLLSDPSDPERVLCQYTKSGPSTFGLDFRYPLGVVQAFGISLTSILWQ